jgi:hypothetical protein
VAWANLKGRTDEVRRPQSFHPSCRTSGRVLRATSPKEIFLFSTIHHPMAAPQPHLVHQVIKTHLSAERFSNYHQSEATPSFEIDAAIWTDLKLHGLSDSHSTHYPFDLCTALTTRSEVEVERILAVLKEQHEEMHKEGLLGPQGRIQCTESFVSGRPA